ncbi:MAG: LysE family transporter [Anaerolineae bacterium]|nr:LysE family transporter [Anaerolineae bacterium]
MVYLVQGVGYGFAAAAQPGPFQAYLLSQTLKRGWRRALPIALAPLISDGPIIALVLLVLSRVPEGMIRVLQIAGGLFTLYLAWRAYRAWRAEDARAVEVRAPPRTLLHAALMNALAPGPYLYWSTITGPILITGWRAAPANGVGLLAGFYAAMVSTLAAMIVLFGTAQRLGARVTRVLCAASVVILAGFGLYQLAQGLSGVSWLNEGFPSGTSLWAYDAGIYYRAGRAVLTRISPYAVYGFYSPFPMALLWAPLALFPLPVVYAVYVMINVWLLWRQMGWRMIWAVLSFPVLFTLFVGQVDLAFGLVLALLGPLAMPLVLMKPQTALVALPWMARHVRRRTLSYGLVASVCVLGISFAIRPTWLGEWLQALPTRTDYARRDSSLFWLLPTQAKGTATWFALAIGLGLGILLDRRGQSWAAVHLFSPVTNVYSVAALAEWIGPVSMLLSWAAILCVGGDIHSGAPMFVVGLAIWVQQSECFQRHARALYACARSRLRS